MKIALARYFILLLLGVAGFSCKDAAPFAPDVLDPHAVLIPLNPGNDWLYQVIEYDSSGRIMWSGPVYYRISKDTTVNGVKWSLQGRQTPTPDLIAYRNDTSGLHMSDFQGIDVAYPYPGKKGDSYDEGILETTDSLVTTAMGLFRCYVFKSELNGVAYRHMYAPGYGKVRDEYVSVAPNGKTYISLRMELFVAHINYSFTN